MKHCAKKLLGFAFALALCLAVGGKCACRWAGGGGCVDAVGRVDAGR